MAISMSGWIVPVVLESIGVIPSSWQIVGGALILQTHAFAIVGSFTIVFLFLTTMLTIWLAGVLASRVTKAHHVAKHKLITQAWHLKQLLPTS